MNRRPLPQIPDEKKLKKAEVPKIPDDTIVETPLNVLKLDQYRSLQRGKNDQIYVVGGAKNTNEHLDSFQPSKKFMSLQRGLTVSSVATVSDYKTTNLKKSNQPYDLYAVTEL